MTKTLALKYIYYESLLLGFLPFNFSVSSSNFHAKPFTKYRSNIQLTFLSIYVIIITILHVKLFLEHVLNNLVVMVFLMGQNVLFHLQFLPLFYQLLFKRQQFLSILNQATTIAFKTFGMNLPENFLKQLTIKLILNLACSSVNAIIFMVVYHNTVSSFLIIVSVFDCMKLMILSNFLFVPFEFLSMLVGNLHLSLMNDLKTSNVFLNEKVTHRMKKMFMLYECSMKFEDIFGVSIFAVTAATFVILIGYVSFISSSIILF